MRVINRKPGGDLLLNARHERGIALRVERHHNHASQEAAKETADPFRAVRGPQQDALAFGDAARFQFARELMGDPRSSFVSPSLSSQATAMREGGFVSPRNELIQIAEDGCPHKPRRY